MPSPLTRSGALAFGALALTSAYRAPSVMKYRIDQSLTQVIDASGVGGNSEDLSFHASSFVTVSLADSAGGKVMGVVVDSLQGDGGTPIPQPVLDSARGAQFRGFVARSGKPGRLQVASPNSAAVQVQGLLSDFFPWVKPGLKVGERWVDTTAKMDGVGADSVTVLRVSAYRAAGNDTRISRKAMRVTEDFTSSIAGTQPTPNGPARIEGSTSGKGAYYVGTDGRYLGGDWEQQSSLTMSGTFASEPLPITIVKKMAVTPLKFSR